MSIASSSSACPERSRMGDQALDAPQHKAFARRFGEIFIHPNYLGMSDDPEILMVRREPGDTTYVGEDWHADTTMWPLGGDLGRRWALSWAARRRRQAPDGLGADRNTGW